MRRWFRKDPPPGWQPETVEIDQALQNVRVKADAATAMMAAAGLRMADAQTHLERAAWLAKHSTSSRTATAAGPTASAPWTATDIAAREEYERLRDN